MTSHQTGHVSVDRSVIFGSLKVAGVESGTSHDERMRFRFQAPPPARGFVHREEVNQAGSWLLSAEASEGSYDPAPVLALRGAGGFDKTTLARAVCQQATIRNRFSDGILWSRIGSTVDDWIGALSRALWRWSGIEPRVLRDLEDISVFVKDLTSSKRLLWVLDDVGDSSVFEALSGLLTPAMILMTTRDGRTLPQGSHCIYVGSLQDYDAARLLRGGSGGGPTSDFTRLAAMLGNWPLLLDLCRAQLRMWIRAQLTPVEAVKRVVAQLRAHGFSALDGVSTDEGAEALSKMIATNFDMQVLYPEDRFAYMQLAVFPAREPIPLEVLEKLWQVSAAQVEARCMRFDAFSLISNLDLRSREFEVHSVLHHYLLKECGPEIVHFHKSLLEKYIPDTGDWADLPADHAYMWNHLFHHLEMAGLEKRRNGLLASYRYLEQRIRVSGPHPFLSDLSKVAQTPAVAQLEALIRSLAHILSKEPEQLASQLLGRLGHRSMLGLRSLVTQASRAGLGIIPRNQPLGLVNGLEQILNGHDAAINSVVSLGPNQLASSSDDRTIRIWSLDRGSAAFTLVGHQDSVYGLASMRNEILFSASQDGTIRMWDVQSGRPLGALVGHTGGVLDVEVLDASHLVSCSRDGTIRVWDFREERLVRTISGHAGWVLSIALFRPGKVVSCSADGTIRVWNLATGQLDRVLCEKTDWYLCLCPVGRNVLVAGSENSTLEVWDITSGALTRTLKGHQGRVRSLAALPEQQVASASEDRTVRVWDLKSGCVLRTFEGHTDSVQGVAWLSPNRIVSACRDMSTRLWNLDRPVDRASSFDHAGAIFDLERLGNRRFATASEDYTIGIWELDSQYGSCQRRRILKGHHDSVLSIVRLHSNLAASGSFDRTIRVWDVATGEALRCLEGHEAEVASLAAIDSKLLVSGSYDHSLRLWDLQSGKCVGSLSGHTYGINAVARLDARHVISASSDKTIRVWDVTAMKTVHELRSHARAVVSIAVLSPHRIISSSGAGTIRVWNLRSGCCEQTITGHRLAVRAIQALDRRRIVTASDDSRVRVWDIENGQTCAAYYSDSPIRAIKPLDNDHLVAGDSTGRIHLLQVKSKKNSTSSGLLKPSDRIDG